MFIKIDPKNDEHETFARKIRDSVFHSFFKLVSYMAIPRAKQYELHHQRLGWRAEERASCASGGQITSLGDQVKGEDAPIVGCGIYATDSPLSASFAVQPAEER